CDDYVDVEPDKLGCDLGIAFGATLRPAILDRDGAALDPAKSSQARHESSRPWSKGRSICAQKPYGWQLSPLLRPRRKRPRRSAAEKRDDLAAPHVEHRGASNRLASPLVRLPSP